MRRFERPSTPARRHPPRGLATSRPAPATLRPMNPDAIPAPVFALAGGTGGILLLVLRVLVGQAVFGAA